MLKKITIAITLLMLSLSAFSQSSLVTRVKGLNSATNGCTINSIAGSYGYTVYRISCPSEGPTSIIMQVNWNTSTDWSAPASGCRVTSQETNYYMNGSCQDFEVRRMYTTPASSSKASVASSSAQSCSPVKIVIEPPCYSTQCSEAFNRTCWAAGGETTWDGYQYHCHRRC